MKTLLMLLLLAKIVCPFAIWCEAHQTQAIQDGIESGVDGKLYQRYSHYMEGYPDAKHVILKSDCKS